MLHMVWEPMLQHLDLYGMNIELRRIELLQIKGNDSINIKEDLAPACQDNYILMVNGKYIYIYFTFWNENGWPWNLTKSLIQTPYFDSVLILNEIATMWFQQDSWSCKSNRCTLQSFRVGVSLWWSNDLCELCCRLLLIHIILLVFEINKLFDICCLVRLNKIVGLMISFQWYPTKLST